MKFDRRLLLPFENDGDIRSMMRGNDGHAYLYVTAMKVPSGPPRERGEAEQVAGVGQQEALQCQPSVDMVVQSVGSRGVVHDKGESSQLGDAGAVAEKFGR